MGHMGGKKALSFTIYVYFPEKGKILLDLVDG